MFSILLTICAACNSDAVASPKTNADALWRVHRTVVVTAADTLSVTVGDHMLLQNPFSADEDSQHYAELFGPPLITWTTHDSTLATIDQEGRLEGVTAGVTAIKASVCPNHWHPDQCNTWIGPVRVVGSVSTDDTPPAPPDTTSGPGETPSTDGEQPAPNDVMKRVLGPMPSAAFARTASSAFGAFEDRFRRWADYHWAAHGAAWEASNYYDRAMIYYAWWIQTGNTTYLDRANKIAVDYRTGYLEAQKAPYQYNASSYWSMPTGVALHYLATGDEASRRAVGYSAEWLTSNWFYSRLAGHTEMENRIRARLLQAAVLAHAINAPQGGPAVGQVILAPGKTWAEKSKNILNEILKAQGADGSWKDTEHCGYEKPFMDALLMESLIL